MGARANLTGDIKFYDTAGVAHVVARDQYRSKLLPDQFIKANDDPDALRGAIAIALMDGFFEEAVAPARRLVEIDPDPARAINTLGVALMRSGDPDEARDIYESYLRDTGPDGYILTNLAKAYDMCGDRPRAEQTLSEGLECDPNQENAVIWWGAIYRERGGDQGFLDAMRRLALVPGSWRAQLWLNRKLLEDGRVDEALASYRSLLPAAGKDGGALMMISGDLGKNEHAREALDLVGPVYDPATHGIETGVNLVQACIQLGEVRRGRRLIAELRALGRYDWFKYLDALQDQLKPAWVTRLASASSGLRKRYADIKRSASR